MLHPSRFGENLLVLFLVQARNFTCTVKSKADNCRATAETVLMGLATMALRSMASETTSTRRIMIMPVPC